ncbi:MAG TPA: hypothetical protein VGM17_09460 [Rhizomicrobium sp.]|jgi:hypothetical protein
MSQQAIGQFGRAAQPPAADADRVEPHFAEMPSIPDGDAAIEAEIQRFTESGELPGADPRQTLAGSDPAALEHARQCWLAEQRQRLADAEAAWESRNRNRTAAARMTVQRAEATMEQLRRQLLQTQEALAGKDAEIAKAWAACEQERARWGDSPATLQQKTAREQNIERRVKMIMRIFREFAWTALVIALATLAAERAAPVAVGVWKQETGPNSHLKPLLQKAGLPLVLPEKAPGWTIAAPIANLRTRPASGAPILMVLPLNTAVTPAASYGKWTFVRVGDGTTEQQGWVATASLVASKK